MGRFRHKRVTRRPGPVYAHLHAHRRKLERAERRRQWTRQQQAQWAVLHGICPDRSSQNRLAHLISRMTGSDRGAQESALAELELATLLIRAGFHVALLPEPQTKTADLLCWLGERRFFVEVTALVGWGSRQTPVAHAQARHKEDQDGEDGPHLLMARLLARIKQKARQLAQYQAPVVLAATVPHRHPQELARNHRLSAALDLKLLAGTVTVLLRRLPHLTAVLLSLWDVEPLPAQSGVRLANVHVVERSRQQAAYPRVRLLVLNPGAAFPLTGAEVERLKGML